MHRLSRSESISALGVAQAELAGIRVLVVDDNATNRRILEEMLLHWEMRPTLANSADAAFLLLHEAADRDEPFALLISDVQMPHEDGFQLVARIRDVPALAEIKVILLTSGGQPDERGRLAPLRIGKVLYKPAKSKDLLRAIRQVLAGATPAGEDRPAATEPLRDDGEPLRILLVEDGAINQRLGVSLLERWGHRATVAGNGQEAVDLVARQDFDVVLMDVRMPVMDGLAATRAIRAAERQRGTHVPILALTAHALKGDREMCLEAGMDGYISKPFRKDELFAAIREVLDRD